MLSATVDALYVSSRPGSLDLSAESVILAFVVGIGVAVASALAPAREARRFRPQKPWRAAGREYSIRVERKRDALLALLLAVIGRPARVFPPSPASRSWAILSALLLIVASCAAIPAAGVMRCTSIGASALRALLGVEAMLASRSLAGSLRRTSVLVGALVDGHRHDDVGGHHGGQLSADGGHLDGRANFRPTCTCGPPVIRPPTGIRRSRPTWPTASQVCPASRASAASALTKSNTRACPPRWRARKSNPNRPREFSNFLSGRPPRRRPCRISRGRCSNCQRAVCQQASCPGGRQHHASAGRPAGRLPHDRHLLRLRQRSGLHLLDRVTLLRYLPDRAPTNLAVYLAPGADLETCAQRYQEAAAAHDVMIFSNREIRREGHTGLRPDLRHHLCAGGGRRPRGGMRHCGRADIHRHRPPPRVRAAALSGRDIRADPQADPGRGRTDWHPGQYAGLALGYVLSLVLIYVINKQSFGWTIQFHGRLSCLAFALSVVYVATVLAGIYPARIAVRLNPIEVMHEE